MPLTVAEYDRLERAITDRKRLALRRRGREYLVVPERLRVDGGREIILTRHPSTGHHMELYVDELDSVKAVE